MGTETSRLVDNGNGEYDPTKNYAKRTSRKFHRDSFVKAIDNWTQQKRKTARSNRKSKLLNSLKALDVDELDTSEYQSDAVELSSRLSQGLGRSAQKQQNRGSGGETSRSVPLETSLSRSRRPPRRHSRDALSSVESVPMFAEGVITSEISTPKHQTSTFASKDSPKGYASTSPVRSPGNDSTSGGEVAGKPQKHLAHLKFKKSAFAKGTIDEGQRSPSMRAGGTQPPPPPTLHSAPSLGNSEVDRRDPGSPITELSNGEKQIISWFERLVALDRNRALVMLGKLGHCLESVPTSRRNKAHISTKPKVESKERALETELGVGEDITSSDKSVSAKKTGKNVDADDLPGQRPFSVFIRKRPLFPHEQESDFDVVDATGLLKENSLLVFDTRMKADMRGMKMTPNLFVVDKVFDEHASNEVVFDHAVSALADHALDGHFASAFMFGQTGSGKTYTMSSMLRQAGNRIFERLKLGPLVTVSISMFELYGTKCHDLLQQDATSSLDNDEDTREHSLEVGTTEHSLDEPSTGPSASRRQTLKVLEDADGSLQFNGLTEVVCGSTDDFIRELERASANRATSATGVHDQSSRSHAFTTIKLDFGNGEPGELLLVDLAGSERNKDSMTHDAQTQREGAEINKSLMALKDCFRAQAKGSSFVPFRASMLTRILKRALTDETAKTSLIATVSPSSGDTEHTLSTLNNISMMLSRSDGGTVSRKLKTEEVRSIASIEAEAAYKKAREADPKGWNKGQVKEWWARHAPPQIPAPSTTGVLLARWPEARFVQYCQDSLKRGSGASSAHSTPSLQPPNASQVGTALYTALRANVEDVRKQQLRRVMANRG